MATWSSYDCSIQHTPTSLRSVYTTHNRCHHSEHSCPAPEVDRDAEGLQVDPNGPYPYPTTRAIDSASKHWLPWIRSTASSEKELTKGEDGLIPYVHEKSRESEKIWRFKRRPFIIVASICVLLVICAAVGGAVGGYYATKSSSSSTPTPTPTSSPDDPDDPMTQTGAVETGTTGMAHLPCAPAIVSPASAPQATPRDITSPYESSTGSHPSYDITCRRGVPSGGDENHHAIVNLRTYITYNFTACMDHCSQLKACMGVVYGANLTEMVTDGDPGGNCLLKNATWSPTARRDSWMASAVKRV